MKRLFWLVTGGALGVAATRKLTRARANLRVAATQRLTPKGITATARQSATNLVAAARDFVQDVREGQAVREMELKESTGLDGAQLEEPSRR